jgi:hypothetical protein
MARGHFRTDRTICTYCGKRGTTVKRGAKNAPVFLCVKCAGPSQMERAQAARCYINQTVQSQERAERLELAAFMSIFHPEKL